MTTDAFSLNFSFEDEKNASTSPPGVPNSSEDNDTANFLNQEDKQAEVLEDGTLASGDESNLDPFNSEPLEAAGKIEEVQLEETKANTTDINDPFSGYSFDFGGEDSLDDLPAEDNGFELNKESTQINSISEAEFTEPDPSAFPIAPDFSEVENVVEGKSSANEEQSFFLETPEFFGNNDVQGEVSPATETPLNLDDSLDLSEIQMDESRGINESQDVASDSAESNVDDVEPIVLMTPVKVTGNLQDDPFAPFLKDPRHVASVAILGASGIGASHGKWFAKHGCQVVSILGSSDESNATTSEKLKHEFGFDGQVYTSLERLLEETKPEIVCVATPSSFHFVHALESLEAGAHVLCEKPLTYAPARKIRENVAGATELIKTAKKKNLLLGTQLQYGAATPILTKLADLAPEEVGDFAMEMETTNPNAPRDPHELWTDLGPHSVSIAAFLGGEGAILQEDSIQFFPRVEGQMVEASARFSIRREDGRFITVRSITRFAPKDSMWRPPYRRFSFNGRVVSYRGYQTPSGEFAAQFTAPDGYDSHYPDPVDFIVGNFVRAVAGEEELIIDGEFGRQNLEWLLKINA
jgi:predicted dehydrogenase